MGLRGLEKVKGLSVKVADPIRGCLCCDAREGSMAFRTPLQH